MAITRSAKRAIRVAARRRLYNIRRIDAMKNAVKRFEKLLVSGNSADAEKMLSTVYQAIDKAAKRGVIKKNTAARKKSRLIARLRKALGKK